MANQVTPSGGSATPVITGVATAITAFVGRTPKGPTAAPLQCASFADFANNFGGLTENYPLTFVVADFFLNGGTSAHIVRVSPSGGGTSPLGPADLIGREDQRTGIYALEQVDLFNLLCIPPDRDDFPDADLAQVYRQAAAYCRKRSAMLIIDPLGQWSVAASAGHFDQVKPADLGIATSDAANCAVYFPRIKKIDAAAGGAEKVFPASGVIAGVFAASDLRQGVWNAPAGINNPVLGITGLEIALTDAENGVLNPLHVNCLRNLPPTGPVVWGARTLSADPNYQYIAIRRLMIYLEASITRGTEFAAFERNDPALWAKLRGSVGNFLSALWLQGAFVGAAADEAYFAQCDQTTTTSTDIANGVVNIVVGFAPVQPAEFVVIQIQQMAGQGG